MNCRGLIIPASQEGKGASPAEKEKRQMFLHLNSISNSYFSPRELQTILKISLMLPVPLTELKIPFFM